MITDIDCSKYETRLVDDGTLDTVIRVRNTVTHLVREFRYASDLFTKRSSRGLVIRDIEQYVEIAIGDMQEYEYCVEHF